MTRRSLLASSLGVLAWPLARAAEATDRRLVLVVANGGWDTTFVFDPKLGVEGFDGATVDEDPDDPEDRESIVEHAGIPVGVNPVKRPAVSAFFEGWASQCVVANGIWTGAIGHGSALTRMLTGASWGDRPDLAALVGALHGADLPLGAVDFSGLGRFGPFTDACARVGMQHQLAALVDPSRRLDAPEGTWAGPGPDDGGARLIEGWLHDRLDDERRTRGSWWGMRHRVDDWGGALERAQRLREAGVPLDGVVTGGEPALRGDVDVAVDLLERETCAAVMLDSREQWDTHANQVRQHGSFDRTFAGLDHLARRLTDAGLLDRTLVVVLSELGRTPRRNIDQGTDHWPVTSALLFGAGVSGGRVIGGTDPRFDPLPVDLDTGRAVAGGVPITYEHLAAGVLQHLGIDPSGWLPGVQPVGI